MRGWPAGSTGRRRRTSELYLRIRDGILDGSYAAGSALGATSLAEDLGCRKSEARAALAHLLEAGLVAGSPRGEVKVIDDAALGQALDVQPVVARMHGLAMELAAPRFTPNDLQAMREANARFARALADGDIEEVLAADDAFHDIAVQASGNMTVAAVLEEYMPVVRRLERLRFLVVYGDRSVSQHARLIDLCEAGDVGAAAELAEAIWHGLADVSFPKLRRPRPSEGSGGDAPPQRGPAGPVTGPR